MSEDICPSCGRLTWQVWMPEWCGRKCTECGDIDWDDEEELGLCWINLESAMDEMEMSTKSQTPEALALYDAVNALCTALKHVH